MAEWRELAHVKEHTPRELGDSVVVQNQAGNKPLRWTRRGVVLEVLPNRQYKVRMDGSRMIKLRNRKCPRKFTPVHQNLGDKLRKLPPTVTVHTPACQINSYTEPGLPVQQHPQPDTRPDLPVPKQQPVTDTAPPPSLPQPETVWHPQQDLEPQVDWPSAVEPEQAQLPALIYPSAYPVVVTRLSPAGSKITTC